MRKFAFITLVPAILIGTQLFGQASDCSDGLAGCDAVANGFPISPSGSGLINEYNPTGSSANLVSWPSPNPQGVNSGCMFAGELNSTWISFTVGTTSPGGLLEFTIGQSGGGGYYDWIMWPNPNGTACTDIVNNTLPPVACNWNASSQGFTGMSAPGNLPPGGVSGNFQPALSVSPGDQFILCFSNYSGLSGITVPFTGTGGTTLNCTSPTTISNVSICAGDTTTLTIQGIPPNITSYSWSPATWISNPNTGPSVDVWPPDTTIYTVTMVSPDSTWQNTVTVFAHSAAVPNAGLDDSICFGSSPAYQLQGQLGNSGSTGYSWSYTGPSGTPAPPFVVFQPNNTSLTPSIIPNFSGQYQFVLTEPDIQGLCPNTSDTVNIFFSSESHTTAFTDPTCAGYADGTITITSTGVLGAVEYSFDGGLTFVSNNVMTGLTSGSYTVISRDIVGCQAQSVVVLTDPPAINFSASGDSTLCINGSGLLSALASGGAPGSTFDYYWSHTSSSTNIQPVTPAPPGTNMVIDVYALSNIGCSSDTLQLFIDHYQPITASISVNDSICPGYDASQSVNASGGYQGYDYSWTANGASMTDNANTINVNPSVNTTYCVTISDGCETDPITLCTDVIMRAVPVPIFSSDTTAGCEPTIIEFTNLTDPSLSDSIIWTVGGSQIFNQSSFSHQFVEDGTYDVSLHVYSEYGCHDIIYAPEYITIHPLPQPNFYSNPNPTTIYQTEVSLNNVTPGQNNSYQWYLQGGSPASSNQESPTVLYPEGYQGDYPVTLVVTTEFNCVAEVSSIIHVLNDVLLFAPNVFTPDGDQYNDSWRVYIDGIDIYDFHLTLFNRWGEIVWESYNTEAAWQGDYASRGSNDNTFVWVIECKDKFSDKKYEFRGHVTVLK